MQVYILLATYNGAFYIDEQIESIRNQTYQDWKLLIRDDGSTDNTIEIIKNFAKKDSRIELVVDSGRNLGVIANFSRLAEIALSRNANYVLFCDQDDIWKHNKIRLSVNHMQSEESSCHKETPVLIHSDLEVIDKDKSTINSSFMNFQRLHHCNKSQTEVLLTHNFVTGCTVIMNSSLLKIAIPIPDTAIMHDWWFALVASATGKLAFIPEKTIYYRQHDYNVEGSKGFLSKLNLFDGKMWNVILRYQKKHKSSFLQACSLYTIVKHQSVNETVTNRIRAYCALADSNMSSYSKLLLLFRSRAHMQGLMRNMVFYYISLKYIFTKT